MRLRWLDGLVLFYGILLIVFALYGFFATKSMMSLISGSVAGLLEIGFAAYSRTNQRVGRIGCAAVSLALCGFFIPEYFKKGKWDFFILAAASLIVFVCLLGGHFYAMSQKRKEQPPSPSN